MIVCRQCLQAIESHEGHQTQRKLSVIDDADFIIYGEYDDDGNFIKDEYGTQECVFCEWCKEYVPIDEAYEIQRRLMRNDKS